MLLKIFVFALLACLAGTQAASLEKIDNALDNAVAKDSSQENGTEEPLEALKHFVQLVESLKLNVTVVGSYTNENKNYVEEMMSLSLHMPRNQDGVTKATLDDAKQDEFLQKIEKLNDTELVAGSTRVVEITANGTEVTLVDNGVNLDNFIVSLGMEKLTSTIFPNQPEKINDTFVYLRNYIVNTPGPDNVQNVQFILGNAKVEPLEITPDFPADMQEHIAKILPYYWMMIDDLDTIANAFATDLNNMFQKNAQVMIGPASTFAASGPKTFAHYSVGTSYNVLVFLI